MIETIFKNHGLIVKSVLNSYNLYNNLIVRREELCLAGHEDETGILECAYSLDGKYVGCIDDIESMPFIKNISEFHYRKPDNTKCSIGFSKEESKWYGWSHRGWCSFGVGSTVKVGDCAYKPKDAEDLKRWARAFYVDEGVVHEAEKFNYTCAFDEFKDGRHEDRSKEGFWVIYKYTRFSKDTNEILLCNFMNAFVEYPEVYGRGEWTAQTLEDAKEMASDYADGVN